MKFGVIDIIIIAFILVSGIIGAKKGLFKRIGGLISLAGAVVVTIFVFKYVAAIIQSTNLFNTLDESINSWLLNKNELFGKTIGEATSTGVNEAVSSLGIPAFLSQYLVGDVSSMIETNPDITIAGYFSPTVANFVITVGTAVAIFLIAFIVLKVIISSIKKFADDGGVMSALDRLLGFAFGLVKAFIFVCVFMEAVSLLANIPSIGDTITDFLNEEMFLANDEVKSIAKFFYENNPLLWIMDKLGLGQILSNSNESTNEALRVILTK